MGSSTDGVDGVDVDAGMPGAGRVGGEAPRGQSEARYSHDQKNRQHRQTAGKLILVLYLGRETLDDGSDVLTGFFYCSIRDLAGLIDFY